MLTRAAIAAPTMAWRAVWDNISQSAHLICCATVLADYAKILLLLLSKQDLLCNPLILAYQADQRHQENP